MREMKDSGVAWIGEIPENWNIRKLSGIAPIITDYVASGSFAALSKNVNYLDEPDYAMLVRTADLSGSSNNSVYINEQAYNFLSNSNLYGGEVILSNIGSVGNVFYFIPTYPKNSLAPNAIMINGCENNKFIYYWFCNPTANDELKRIGSHAVQLKFNKTQLRKFWVAYPPVKEQAGIVDILDKKSSQVDAIISNNEAQIEKLKQYKQSLITEVVTKGLDPTVPMKGSGVEWIGEIPAHWEVIQAKRLSQIGHGTDPKTEGDIPVYGSGATSFKTCGEYKEGPTVLIGRKGATLHIPHYIEGRYWNVDTAFDVQTNVELMILKYYYYLAQCFDYKYYVSQTTLPSMTQMSYQNMVLPLPYLAEQESIVAELDTKCTQIDSLISIKQAKIEKLIQYKKSLIYEYVTGKKEV